MFGRPTPPACSSRWRRPWPSWTEAAGRLDPETITPELFAARLFTATLPEPDLVIRTSGEHRLSNFLLWQSAYAELVFVDTLWPDFSRAEFLATLETFAQRERRFGAVAPEAVA